MSSRLNLSRDAVRSRRNLGENMSHRYDNCEPALLFGAAQNLALNFFTANFFYTRSALVPVFGLVPTMPYDIGAPQFQIEHHNHHSPGDPARDKSRLLSFSWQCPLSLFTPADQRGAGLPRHTVRYDTHTVPGQHKSKQAIQTPAGWARGRNSYRYHNMGALFFF
ncbi:unnamed protein product [Tuber aestivum]|uniref:Uncharacterized protein n=1 Tax=Tuber aestivum TaxID=59557 RepID=A0A292Q3L1_9PEZI|nr:unnamed protein product [Tuber aestivum]